MSDGLFQVPPPTNEPIRPHAPGDATTASLKAELARQSAEIIEIPCVIGGREIFSGDTIDITNPSDHSHVIARAHLPTDAMVQDAIDSACAAQAEWAGLAWEDRAGVLLRAAALLTGPWRDTINASTMLCQGKTVHQAEIDAACELIDFWRFNVSYYQDMLASQPPVSPTGIWNRVEIRPLEGFVFAITPFNFTSIALNLPTAPALLGNVVVWKPSTTQLLSAWHGYRLLVEAGLPPGVISFLPGRGAAIGGPVLADRRLAGLHFTGGTPTFQHLWRSIGNNIANYATYPRIVGETGGKDFIIAHPTASVDALAVAIVRGSFEFQGQKCSAASRMYVPESLWPEVRDRVVATMAQMKMGDVRDFSNYIGPVIDQRAFKKHSEYQQLARDTGNVLSGGGANGTTGWFVEPTLVQVDDPSHRLMQEEIFGPIATAWVYPDAKWEEALTHVDQTSPYALTGAVFARDRRAVAQATHALRNAAGNFYINDKPTGAVVGQQPFGGARASGTNDKAGSPLNLIRWASPRTIKETFSPDTDWRYPYFE
jgi:1-pyrroline-5-carboxylate dehydrogenase